LRVFRATWFANFLEEFFQFLGKNAFFACHVFITCK
jgi:hypothetical protein